MKERPILFSAAMVRAILEGRKTQTRRVVAKQPETVDLEPKYEKNTWGFWNGEWPSHGRVVRCPYGVPGDRLWVREVHWRWGKWVRNGLTKSGRTKWKFSPVGTGLRYMENRPKTTAKRDGECGWVYRHSRFMFRAHSRITLELTDVRVQRVQEIRAVDAIAEGIEPVVQMGAYQTFKNYGPLPSAHMLPVDSFHSLWDSINGKTYPWANNDWVWALTFKVLP